MGSCSGAFEQAGSLGQCGLLQAELVWCACAGIEIGVQSRQSMSEKQVRG